jgi:hypothetical protein
MILRQPSQNPNSKARIQVLIACLFLWLNGPIYGPALGVVAAAGKGQKRIGVSFVL